MIERPVLRLVGSGQDHGLGRRKARAGADPVAVCDDYFLDDAVWRDEPAGPAEGQGAGAEPDRWSRTSPCRPGDVLQFRRTAADDAFTRLASEACDLGIDASTAFVLAVERGLILTELARWPHLGHALDQAASRQRIARPLSLPARAYLQQLRERPGESNPSPHLNREADVVVPVRLLDRLPADQPIKLATVNLAQAVAWETAAVASGATMTEWALRVLVDQLAARPSA